VVRFPKGALPADVPAVGRAGGVDVLHRQGDEDVLLIAVGATVPLGLEVADRLAAQGIGVTVVDPRWVLPVDDALVPLAARHRLVVVVEDNGRAGGVGTAVHQRLADEGVPTPLRGFGVPQRFLDHASRGQVLERVGLTAQEVSRQVVEVMAGIDARLEQVRFEG
jgi:1-deoxy-D-xylulose-5-phosphate synthase